MLPCIKQIASGLPRQLSGKESSCRCRRFRLDPWVGKIPWRRKWKPTPVFLPGKSRGQGSLVGYSPWGHRVRHYCELVAKTTLLQRMGHHQAHNMNRSRHLLYSVQRELSSVLCGDLERGLGADGKGIQEGWIYVCIWLIYFIVQQKLTHHCKATIPQLERKEGEDEERRGEKFRTHKTTQ